MPIITQLTVQQHDQERVNVYLDGAFAFGASTLVVMANGLAVGRELLPEDVARLQEEDGIEKTYGAALNFLSFRPRSGRELEEYLCKRKVEPATAQLVIDRLVRAGFLNDREFASFWIENRQSFRPRGTRALRVELRQKGIASEVINDALEGIGDEAETAYLAGLKKVRTFQALDERTFTRKMIAFLQRRGFPYDAAAAATRRLASEGDRESESEE